MAIIETKDIIFHYPGQSKPAVDHVQMRIEPGEFVVIAGPSGSGKSTLLRLLKKDIAPHGSLKGELFYQGIPYSEHPPISHAQEFGFVFQDPENQLVMEYVREELTFGMENLAIPTPSMHRRLAEMTHAFGLEDWLSRKTSELSGGQKQLINLVAILLLEPSILLLDEPTAQLDPVAAKEFLQLIKQMNSEFGMTILMVEHRLEDVLPMADRLVLMDKGKIQYNDAPRQVLADMLQGSDNNYQAYFPSITRLFTLFNRKKESQQFPLTVKEGRQWLMSLDLAEAEGTPLNTEQVKRNKVPLLEACHIDFQYSRSASRLLDRLHLKVMKGDFLAIVGANGTGKSTLLKVMAGLLTPQSGYLKYNGKRLKKGRVPKLGYLPQNPKLFFLEDTVEKELRALIKKYNLENGEAFMEAYLEKYQLSHVRHAHPYDLSGGELQKVALIGVLLGQPELLLIDEPTKGIDPKIKQLLGEHLNELRQLGMTIVLVTHDIDFAATFASKCTMLFNGSMTSVEDVERFFKGNTFYTTAINRLTRRLYRVPEVVTIEEALQRWVT